MDTILLTGATGALGSELLKELLAKRYRVVCLVRAESRKAAYDRIKAIVGIHPNLRVVRGDIREPRCGISDIDREHLIGRIDKILHCAASISFTDKQATLDANVNGVHNALELADTLGVWHFVHVSTAYVAGNVAVFSENDPPSPIRHRPRNEYEQTKQIGETMVRAWGRHTPEHRFTILRPSILIGREDGTTPTFDAYYGYFYPLHRAAEALRVRAREGKSLPADVFVKGEWVTMPLVLRAGAEATLNVIPIDWTAQMMVGLLEAPPRHDTYHLVSTVPPMVRWVIENSLAYLKIKDVRVVETKEEKAAAEASLSPMMKGIQKQVNRVLGQYDPYTNHSVLFLSGAASAELRGKFRLPRPMSAQYIADMLDYARLHHWNEEKVLA